MSKFKRVYPAVEYFALVYVIGMTADILVRRYWGISMSWLPPLLLPAAAWASAWKLRHDPDWTPNLSAYLLTVAGCAAVLAGVKVFIYYQYAATAKMEGPAMWWSMLRRTIWETLLVALILSPWVGKVFFQKKATLSRPSSAPKFELAVGFSSLGTTEFEVQRQQDAHKIGPMFARSLVPPPGQIPATPVLFLYASLNKDGTISGMGRPVGIRQVIEKTKASLVVLATDTLPETIQLAVSLPGPKTANIVFTVDRRNQLFSQFMSHVFEEMGNGHDMLMAWVKVSPQGPQQHRKDLPVTVLIAEGGKIAFPLSKATSDQ